MKKFILAIGFVLGAIGIIRADDQRWIVYTATQAIDCSGGYLTTSGADTFCSTATLPGGTGLPGGPTNSVQFNGGGVLLGTATLTMNTTSNLLTVGATTFFSNVNTTLWTGVSTMTFSTGTVLQLQYVTAGSCLQTDSFGNVVSSTNGACGSGSGSGGTNLLVTTNVFSGGTNFTSPAGSTFTYGVSAGSFTSTGAGVGSLTLKDSGGVNFVSIESSGTLAYSQSYVLPISTGTAGQVLAINSVDGNGKTSTIWATAASPNAAILTATQTFSGTNTFAQTTNFTGISSTTFTGVSSVTFNNVNLISLANSTVTVLGAISANGSYGTAGQVLNSNGPGASVSWGTGGGGGGGGYNLQPATVTPNFALGILVSTIEATGFTQLKGSTTFSGSGSTVTFANQSTSFTGISSMTFNGSSLSLLAGSTLAVNGSFQANNSYGTSGQVLQSNGSGSAPSWSTVTGGAGSGGVNSGTAGQMAYYAVSGTTVSGTSNLVNNTSSITANVTVNHPFGLSSSTGIFSNSVELSTTIAIGAWGVYVGPGSVTYPPIKFVNTSSDGKSFAPLGAFYFDSTYGTSIESSGQTVAQFSPGSTGIKMLYPTVFSGHIEVSSATPILSSCGTSPSIVGNDQWGTITVGSISAASCTMTFAVPWVNAPSCNIMSNTAITSPTGSATTTAFTFGGTVITSDVVMYQCGGYR